jgi:isochorismate synthase
MDAVAKTAEEIAQGQYTKAVLARRATTVRPPGLTLDKVLQALTNRYPNTFVYAFHGPGAWFVGASPERLVRVEAGQVTVDCLAGTVATGADDAESEALFAQLFNSRKDRAEHQVVVRSVTETLASVLAEVNVPAEPSLKKLQNVQHLWTEVRGRVRPGVTALDLAARLHPTPAVAGVPRDVALQVIAARESMDRGWYAGPIGWLTASGDGEFAVALRSALFKGDAVHLYAGAGIMGDSQPAAELRETELKLQAVRNAIFEEHA